MKRSALGLISLALLAWALAAWWNSPPLEPRFDGHPLSMWIRIHTRFIEHDLQIPTRDLRSLGLPAVTWLAYKAEHGHKKGEEPSLFAKLLAKIPWRKRASPWPMKYSERTEAMCLLGRMGSMAKPAIPAMLRLLEDHPSNEPFAVSAASRVLHKIGPDSWPIVEERLAHGPKRVRRALIATMYDRVYPEDDPVSVEEAARVFALLTQALQDPDPKVGYCAAYSIGNAICFSKNLPPALIDQSAAPLWSFPNERNRQVRHGKAWAMSYYEKTRKESVPRLTALLTDPDEAKRNFARTILAKLDPLSQTAQTAATAP